MKFSRISHPAIIAFAVLQIMLPGRSGAQEDINYSLARLYFSQMDSLCSIDNGKTWGVNLYGPTMLVITESRTILANQPDTEGRLTEHEGVFTGTLPSDIAIANYAAEWSGKRWAVVNWGALSQNDSYLRNKLLIHENWHSRVEAEIGISPVMTSNMHLDGMQGSILIKLEMRALRKALLSGEKVNKKNALKDALIIRKYRQGLFPGNNENDFERHEGMPEYTGYKLCGLHTSIIAKAVAKQLECAQSKDGFANSFAYLTGPAYGFIFDDLHIDWRKQIIAGNNVTEIAESIISGEVPSDTVQLKMLVENAGSKYGYKALIQNETEKFEKQKKLRDMYVNKFLKGNQLVIQNSNLRFSFNPQEKLIPIDNGVIYKTMHIIGEWGILDVQDGIYRSNNWMVFIVPAPKPVNSKKMDENGYVLTLKEGWKVVQIQKGKYTIRKQ